MDPPERAGRLSGRHAHQRKLRSVPVGPGIATGGSIGVLGDLRIAQHIAATPYRLDQFRPVESGLQLLPDFRNEYLDDLLVGLVPAAIKVVDQHVPGHDLPFPEGERSGEHTSELQSLMRISYAVFCLK